MRHTYKLIKAQFPWKQDNKTKEKYESSDCCFKKASPHYVLLFFFFFLLSSLSKSRGNVSVYLKSKLTIKVIVPFSPRVSSEQ